MSSWQSMDLLIKLVRVPLFVGRRLGHVVLPKLPERPVAILRFGKNLMFYDVVANKAEAEAVSSANIRSFWGSLIFFFKNSQCSAVQCSTWPGL